MVLVRLACERRRIHEARPGVKPRQPVPRTRHQLKELGSRPNKIDNLRYKEQQQRLAEVPEDRNYCKDHAAKVAKRIAHKTVSSEAGLVVRSSLEFTMTP